MGSWKGEDGQYYDSFDKKVGADSRYRQQQEQNKLLEKQNELLEKQANALRDEQQHKEFERKQEIEGKEIEYIIELLMFGENLEEITKLEELEELITKNIKDVYNNLRDDIDYMVEIQKEIIKTKGNKSNISKMDSYWIKIHMESYNEKENLYIRKIRILEDILEQRRKVNINFCDELYEKLYSDIVNYHKEEFGKINQPVKLENKIIDDERKNKREKRKESTFRYFENLKKFVFEIKSKEEEKIKRLKKEKKEFETNIEARKEQINKLNEITTLKDLKQIKENVIDVDYEFSSEIISDLYSVDEVILMIKRHIKELEIELSKEKEKEKYYKLIDYLVNNETYTNLQDYQTYYSDVNYEEEYNRIIKFEKERKEEQRKLEEERKVRDEEEKKLEEDKKRKEEQQRKLEEETQNKKKEEEKNQKTLELYNKKKKYISEYNGCNTTFAIFSIICSAYLPMLPIYIIIWFCFVKALEPKKRYLKNIKNLGFDFNSIEEFEKYILDKGLIKEIENIQYEKRHSNKYYIIWLIICLILFLIFYSVLPTLVVFIVLNINGLVKNKKMEKMRN